MYIFVFQTGGGVRNAVVFAESAAEAFAAMWEHYPHYHGYQLLRCEVEQAGGDPNSLAVLPAEVFAGLSGLGPCGEAYVH